MQYISLDATRAETWIDHAEEKRKPWQVSAQIREIYTSEPERNAAFVNYRRLSMAKHCNPVGEVLAFPIAAKRHSLRLDASRNNSCMIAISLFMLGDCIHETFKAAATILAAEGFDVGTFSHDLKGQIDILSKLQEKQLISIIRAESP